MTETQPIPTRDGGGHYDLLESIESGVLAEAWFARTPPRRTGPALVRVLRPAPAVCADARSRDAFLEALFAQSAVHHPLLVRVLDISSRERPYAVFELVEAIPLEDLLEGARATSYPISLAAAMRITLDIAAALEALHAAGLGHGDVSDRSVLLAASGFGLVTPTGLGVAACRLRREIVAPTLAYKPKEQLERSQVSPQADVFALGALVFEMLAGRRVFEGEGEQLLASVSAGQVPRLDDVQSGIARPFADVVALALSAEPGARFATANAFATELERAAGPALAARADLGRLFGRLAAQDIAALRMTLTPLIEARESLASFPAREELPAPGASEPTPETPANPEEAARPPNVVVVSPATPAVTKAGAASGVLAAHLGSDARRGSATGHEPSVIIKDEAGADKAGGYRATMKTSPRVEPAPTSAPAVASIVTDSDDDLAFLERSGAAQKRRMIGAGALIAAAIIGFIVISQLGTAESPPEPDKPQPTATVQPAAAAPAPAPLPETTTQDVPGETAPPASAPAAVESSNSPRKASAAPRRAPAPPKPAPKAAPRAAPKPAAAPRNKIPAGI